MLWEATAAQRNTPCNVDYGTWLKNILNAKAAGKTFNTDTSTCSGVSTKRSVLEPALTTPALELRQAIRGAPSTTVTMITASYTTVIPVSVTSRINGKLWSGTVRIRTRNLFSILRRLLTLYAPFLVRRNVDSCDVICFDAYNLSCCSYFSRPSIHDSKLQCSASTPPAQPCTRFSSPCHIHLGKRGHRCTCPCVVRCCIDFCSAVPCRWDIIESLSVQLCWGRPG